ncbi:hypothetical protein TRFO_11811 [Tritrichomonas foetus]|uniref:Uncharacterized protein n=1 Tax=Tritrichomonas foetus TaxID=1144522 RepID=A0A1J4J1I9_9EUKA|nr:hypothetical protein [Tritrichomonas foetus]OHS93400.1 hypothetical protein TRFO_11811 [Tritrichomonas foetus]|eukprot:OHS93400.1 hypothetical protein TRFO_11811 [Tritrichomonas foetus]
MYDSESSRIEYSELDSSRARLPRDSELKDANDELLKENTVLRSQFEDAIKITRQLEELHSQNNELHSTIRTLRAENEDLTHRLEISLQSNKEMSAKLNDEKRSCTTIRGTDLNSMTKEIEKIKQQSKAQLDSIYDQLEKSKQSIERESVEKRLLASKLDHILEDSQRYFQTRFNNIDEFMIFLSTPPVAQETAIASTTTGTGTTTLTTGTTSSLQQQNTIDRLERKLKHLKNKLKASLTTTTSLEDQITKKQQEFNTERSTLRNQITNLEHNVQEVEDSKKQIETTLNYQITALQQKYSNLNKKYDSLTEQYKNVQTEQKELRKNNSQLQKELDEVTLKLQFAKDHQRQQEEELSIVHQQQKHLSPSSSLSSHLQLNQQQQQHFTDESLLQRNEELQEQLLTVQKKRDELTNLLRQSETTNNNLIITVEKHKSEYEALQHLHESDQEEIEALRRALHIKETTEQEIREKNKNAPRQPSTRILKLQKALDHEKQKVYQLQALENKLNTRIEDLESELRLATQTVQDSERETERARNELQDVRRQLENQQPLTADDLLPPNVFNCEEFDPSLSSAIVRIANNSALQPVSKLHNCFKTIRKHYGKQIQSRDEALDQAFNENQTLSNSFNQFLVDASIALNDQAVTLQDFFGYNAGHKIVDEIAQLRLNQANLRHQYDTLKGFINLFQTTFNPYYPECCTELSQQIQEIRLILENLKEAITLRSKKIHELKAVVRSTNATLKSKEIEYENSLHSLEDVNNELTIKVRHLQNENKTLLEQNNQLTVEINNVTQEREQLESTIIQEQDEHNNSLIENFHKQELQYKHELETKNEQLKQLRLSISTYENEIQKQRQLINSLKTARQQRDQEYAELQRSLNEHEVIANERLETEKKNIIQTFEHAIKELKEQCEKHRCDVQKMATQVSETELKNAQYQQEIKVVRKEKRKMETEVSNMKNQLERERKLMESSIRAQKVQAEATYNSRLEEQRNKFETERRRLIALGTETFRNFFNPSDTIDERSFRCVLDKARDTITRLNNSDLSIRRMLCVAEQQTTPDAVAQLLMNKGCTA